jgi:hypothetical protein
MIATGGPPMASCIVNSRPRIGMPSAAKYPGPTRRQAADPASSLLWVGNRTSPPVKSPDSGGPLEMAAASMPARPRRSSRKRSWNARRDAAVG